MLLLLLLYYYYYYYYFDIYSHCAHVQMLKCALYIYSQLTAIKDENATNATLKLIFFQLDLKILQIINCTDVV